MTDPTDNNPPSPLTYHPRQWRDCVYVYPVVSRRSRGVSIGVNLNHDKRCTFACVYCQVEGRSLPGVARPPSGVACGSQAQPWAAVPQSPPPAALDLALLRRELLLAVEETATGRLWEEPLFRPTPTDMRRLHDIALSGDGEPTCLEDFDKAVGVAADVRRQTGRTELKIIVISNASQFHRPPFQRALPILDANGGEVWAKLDAGTEELFQRINHPYPVVPLRRILDNILAVARGRPVVIQSLFFRLDGAAPSEAAMDAYCHRLQEIIHGGGKIRLVQVYTIARAPSSLQARPLERQELDAIAQKVRAVVSPVPVETY